MLRITHTHTETSDLTTSTGKLLLTAANGGAISVKRMSEALMGWARTANATNTTLILRSAL
jgi:hypothetical protein